MLVRRQVAERGLGSHQGEGYLASSADLMIGILFIFIIMVVYLAVEIKRIQANTGHSVDPVQSLVDVVGQRLQQEGVRVELDPDSGVIALPSDALFDSGSAIPTGEALQAIQKMDEVLSEVLPCYVASAVRRKDCSRLNSRGVELETVMIEGHTDSDQYKNAPEQNWHLGLDRARFIFEELGKHALGQFRNRKGQSLLGVSSYADTRPAKASLNPLNSKAKDRRVELRFILSYQGDDGNGAGAEITRAVSP
jgi:flagellar motor protein MotB